MRITLRHLYLFELRRYLLIIEQGYYLKLKLLLVIENSLFCMLKKKMRKLKNNNRSDFITGKIDDKLF